MGALDYIEELGIGESQAVETEATEEVNAEEQSEDTDFVQEQEDTPTEEAKSDTEQNSEIDALRKQIEGMEKRIADKDEFIQELRNKSKEPEQQEVDTTEDEEGFWDNPEGKIAKLEEMLQKQEQTMRVQQLQIQEGYYAQTVENYWETVNQDALKEAVATDTEFAEAFNKSNEPYKTAYEYLKNKTKAKADKELSLREQIRKELLEEMGVKGSKEVPPAINRNGGTSASGKTKDPEDGFAAVFGGL